MSAVVLRELNALGGVGLCGGWCHLLAEGSTAHAAVAVHEVKVRLVGEAALCRVGHLVGVVSLLKDPLATVPIWTYV